MKQEHFHIRAALLCYLKFQSCANSIPSVGGFVLGLLK